MARPTSRLTRFRFWLATRIDAYPGMNEAWCVNCTLNGHRTMVLGADAVFTHADRHVAETPGEVLRIKSKSTAGQR